MGVSYLNCLSELPSVPLEMERILIVDDDVDLYQLVTQFLNSSHLFAIPAQV